MALHEIYTAQDLKDFRDLVNAGNYNLNAILMNDIDLQGNDLDQWEPIAINSDVPFSGTFDGNGYTISGLYINRSTILDEYGEPDYDIDELAFISHAAGAVIKNLILEGYILGGWYGVAGFVGELRGGKIINCINRVVLTGPEWVHCIGGIVGWCGWGNPRNSEITNCTNDANIGIDIDGSGEFGGIIGFGNVCSITNCINNGDVFGGEYAVAGIAGVYYSANIINCVNNGDITGTDEDVSGIANYLNRDTGDTISNCVNTGTITGVDYVAGITDRIRGDAQIKNCVNEGTIVCFGDNYGAITSELDISITTYPQNNYYLDTSCDRACLDKNDNYSVVISIPDSITSYTENNAPTVASMIEDFKINKKIITPKIYPDINTDITSVTFSNWSVSGTINANIENDTVVLLPPIGGNILPPTVPKKEIIIDKL